MMEQDIFMTDLKRKQFLYYLVEHYVNDENRIASQGSDLLANIRFARHCEIITDSEADDLRNRVREIWVKNL